MASLFFISFLGSFVTLFFLNAVWRSIHLVNRIQGGAALKNARKTSSKKKIYESCEFCFSVNSSLSINPLNLFSAEASQSLFSWLPQGKERLSIKNAYVLSYCLAHLT